MTEEDRLRPRVVSEQIITGLDNHQAVLINRVRYGDMLTAGDTLYVLECHPAGYAAYACNEAEKSASINVVDLRYFGAFGRLQLRGNEEDINQASAAIRGALEAVSGRENTP
jgi:hypothetical protein